MSRANLTVFERSEFSEFAANINFYPLKNLASNELFLYYSTYIAPEAADETCAAYLFRYPLTLGS